MQTVFKVLERCSIPTDLVSVANYMSTAELTRLIEAQRPRLSDKKTLIIEAGQVVQN